MDKFTDKELEASLKVINSTINNCEKQQPKFPEGTAQNTLLKNRIRALYISKALIENEDNKERYSREDLVNALEPVKSIIRKCEKAILKSKEGTSSYSRLEKIIAAMHIAEGLISENIS